MPSRLRTSAGVINPPFFFSLSPKAYSLLLFAGWSMDWVFVNASFPTRSRSYTIDLRVCPWGTTLALYFGLIFFFFISLEGA
ncbi:hypothetical protein BDY21DRAFT_354151 [Lineolata rhizophorae]|uniref:Uncharacterized protein n=1 Tax=Lineolata rhizophorae TaxID=578093 RepID=A0A6A6NQM9_9PEZI|nr:hypothetical protein BDY21DRAFT_354151 [Lineolata rhizophorae]